MPRTPPCTVRPLRRSLEHYQILRTLSCLNKEVRPFFLSDNSIWSSPSVSSLSDYSISSCPEGYFSLAIIASGAFQFIVPKYYYRLGNMELKESRLLISPGGYGLQGVRNSWITFLGFPAHGCMSERSSLVWFRRAANPWAKKESEPILGEGDAMKHFSQ